jgi:hypothetical protein
MRAVVILAVVMGVLVGASAALARNQPPIRSCGQIVFRVPHTGHLNITYVQQVDARRLSCGRALAFVRAWTHLGDEGKLPDQAGGKSRRAVVVYYQWARPYRVSGFVCRSMAIPAVRVEPGRVTCGARTGLVTWHETGPLLSTP